MTSQHLDGFNPYAAPTDDGAFAPSAQPGENLHGSYYSMGTTKLWLLTVLSFGLYGVVFFYRHWRHLRDHQHEDVSPLPRAIFGGFTYFGLNSRVVDSARFAQVQTPTLLGVAPILYLVTNVGGRLADRTADPDSAWVVPVSVAVVVIAAACLASTQTTVNRLLAHEGYRGPSNTGPTIGSAVLVILGGLVWAGAIFGSLGAV